MEISQLNKVSSEKVYKGSSVVRSALTRLLGLCKRELLYPNHFTAKHKYSDTYAGPKHCLTFNVLNEEENSNQCK